jgi:DNA-directed RNA polymerase specialized sigma24 family protein
VVTQDLLREESALTKLAFTRLLAWLDAGTDSDGRAYLEIRRRLVSYFERRDRSFPDDLADETLSRVARTLATSGTIAVTPPARYCYVVARFVLLEDLRRERRHIPVTEARIVRTERTVVDSDAEAKQERRLQCLDRCLLALKPEQRNLVVEYYRDANRQRIERRRALASRLGITMNALGIRACRIRGRLEACVSACCDRRTSGDRVKGKAPRLPIPVDEGALDAGA